MKKFALSLAFVLPVLLTGCEAIQQLSDTKINRKVIENNLISEKYPKAVISINKEYEYIGMVPTSEWVRHSVGSGGAFHNNSSFLFTRPDKDGFLDSIIAVNFWEISSGQWISGFEKEGNIKIGKITKDDYRFDTAIYISSPSRSDEQVKFVEDEGYIVPSCMIYKGYKKLFQSGRLENKRIYVTYSEQIECDDSVKFIPENINTKSSKKFLEEFNHRADYSFEVSHI